MASETPYGLWEYRRETKTVRLNRSFEFETSEDSERFASQLGTAISFPNLAVYVDPLVGAPEARVTIECSGDSMSLATAHQLLDSFQGIHEAHQAKTSSEVLEKCRFMPFSDTTALGGRSEFCSNRLR